MPSELMRELSSTPSEFNTAFFKELINAVARESVQIFVLVCGTAVGGMLVALGATSGLFVG